MKKIIKPKINKKCNVCGQSHFVIPKNAREQKDIMGKKVIGLFWECACFNTMFVRVENENIGA